MNTKATGKTFQEIAASMAGSLIPKTGEIQETVASLLKNSNKYQTAVAQEHLTSALTRGHIEEDVINDIVGGMKGQNIEEAINSVAGRTEKELGEDANAYLTKAKEDAKRQLEDTDQSTVLENASKFGKYTRYPQAYFNSPDKKVNQARIGAVVGTYAGATVGARFLSVETLRQIVMDEKILWAFHSYRKEVSQWIR